MSLRSFHILFILTAMALLGFLGWWSGSRAWAGENGQNSVLAAFSIAGLVAGVPYLAWFIKKTRSLSP